MKLCRNIALVFITVWCPSTLLYAPPLNSIDRELGQTEGVPHLAQMQIWTYTGDQVSSSTFGGKKTSYTYDTEGRLIIMGLGNGVVVTTSYDENSYVVDETTKYPTGVKEKLTFSRSFYPDKTISIETMTKETLNANGQPANGVGDTTEVHYSDMANGHEVLVTKLNGIENYRR